MTMFNKIMSDSRSHLSHQEGAVAIFVAEGDILSALASEGFEQHTYRDGGFVRATNLYFNSGTEECIFVDYGNSRQWTYVDAEGVPMSAPLLAGRRQ